jgi:hypothetical protein
VVTAAVVAAAKVVEVKVVAAVDARRVVEAEADRVVADRAVAVVDVPLVVAVDKVVAGEAVARVVAEVETPVAEEDREVEAAVVDVPAVAGAAETVNSLSSSGASRERGAPFFY